MLKWDKRFLDLAKCISEWSLDPSTKVGAVIVTPDRQIVSVGFNGFPRGVKDDERLLDREIKLKLIVHAEMTAVLAAANLGIRVQGCTMYMCASSNGVLWGSVPCTRCGVQIIQSGITEIVTVENENVPSRWLEDLAFSKTILEEAGIKCRQVDYK